MSTSQPKLKGIRRQVSQATSRPACVGRSYYDRKVAEGKSHNEAMRCLKRRIADHVWRLMLQDERLHEGTTGSPAIAS